MRRIARIPIGLLIAIVTSIVATTGAVASTDSAQTDANQNTKKQRGRVETVPYQAPDGSAFVISSNLQLGVATVVLSGGPERFLSLQIKDSTGQPVAADIIQSNGTLVADVCGSTEHPLRIEPNLDVTVTLYIGRCADSSPSIVTGGEVIATFLQRSPDPRVQVAEYSPAFGGGGFDGQRRYLTTAKIPFPAGPERFVSVAIADQSGAAVPAHVVQGDVVATFCGKTAKPVRIRPNFPMTVEILNGPCPGQEGIGAATRGSVEATFSRHRP